MKKLQVTGGTKADAEKEAHKQNEDFIFMYSEIKKNTKEKVYYFVI
jgi:hypothetical protein